MDTRKESEARRLYTVEPFGRRGELAVLDRGDTPPEERFNCYVGSEAYGWVVARSFVRVAS